jgi:flavin-dependent dehydrogenase
VVVAVSHYAADLSRDVRVVFRRALQRCGVEWAADADVVAGPWVSGPFDWPVQGPTASGVLLVGDAAGYYDPLTGQGIYRALRSAELAAATAHAILSGVCDQQTARRAYVADLARTVRPGRRVQKLIEAVTSTRVTRELAFRQLARRPSWANQLVRVTGDAVPVRSLGGLLAPTALLSRRD